MGKIISIFNQKGGVGKTTTAVNLSACIAKNEKKVLIVDIDPQGNGTSGIGLDKKNLENTIYEIIIDEDVDVKTAIYETGIEGLDIIPSNADLAGAAIELVNLPRREIRLKNALDKVKDEYDYIFIDCPPSLGLLTLNSLAASNTVLIPIQCEFYALEGVSELMNTIKLVKQGLNPNIDIQGIILSMFDGRTNLSFQVVEEVKKYFKNKVYTTIIPRNVRLAEAPSYGQPISIYDPKSKGAEAYFDFAEEFLELEEEE